jgi:hypothetical protein
VGIVWLDSPLLLSLLAAAHRERAWFCGVDGLGLAGSVRVVIVLVGYRLGLCLDYGRGGSGMARPVYGIVDVQPLMFIRCLSMHSRSSRMLT